VRHYLELPQSLELRDPETGAFGLSFFVEYAEKELIRSQRYGRPFSLVTLRVEGVRELAHMHGAEPIRTLLRAVLAAVGRVARDVDLVARMDDEEFGLLLPETDHFGALMFQRRALAAVADDGRVKELTSTLPVSLSVGASTHGRDGRDLDALLSAARGRAKQGRRSLARRLASLEFWPSVWELLDGELSSLVPGGGIASLDGEDLQPSNRRLSMSAETMRSVRAEVMRQVAREANGRGLLYASAGADAIHASLPMLESLSRGGAAWTVHLLGRRGPSTLVHPVVTPVYVDAQDPICRHDLLLYLSEQTAYALVRKAGEEATAFHSSDGPLVDHLITRLQQAYDLHSY